MDFWSIVGNIVATIICGIAVFLFGRWQGWWAQAKAKRLRAKADDTKFAILVADLDGDASQTQTRHILQSLRTQFAEAIERRDLQVLSRGEALRSSAGDIKDGDIALQNRGRAWLKEQKADVLIWGETAQEHKLLRLRFLQPQGATASAKPYELDTKLELPPDFGADLGAIIAVQAAASMAPVYERSGEALAELIEPVVAKLRPLAENPPTSMSGDARVRLWRAYALGEHRLGEERGDNARLVSAIAYCRKVLEQWTRERAPLDWATTQNNLGTALQSLGERESGTARLDEAVAAYREALKERTRDRVPLDWAGTQNNLGTALMRLGEREAGMARLKEAVTAYREALKEWTRDRVPLDWAATQTGLGAALRHLGEREVGTARLEEAVQAYREALKERIRERVPLDWAGTQTNLGSALRSLGERAAGTDKAKGCAALEAAREHHAEALEEFRKAGATHYVGVVEGNIARLDGDIARLCG